MRFWCGDYCMTIARLLSLAGLLSAGSVLWVFQDALPYRAWATGMNGVGIATGGLLANWLASARRRRGEGPQGDHP